MPSIDQQNPATVIRLSLTSADKAWEIELPMDGEAIGVLAQQMNKLKKNKEQYRAVTRHLGMAIGLEISRIIDWDLCTPTPKQTALAKNIMNALGVGLPSNARIYRSAMEEFLSRHRVQYSAYRKKQR